MADLLIFTPTHEDGPDARCLESVRNQQTDVLWQHEVSWLDDPLPGRNFANVVRQYQKGWQMALDGDYHGLLTVEHDMIIPPDAIEKLYATPAPVVYGVYMLRHGTHTLNAWQYIGTNNMGMSLSLYPNELAKYRKRGWAEVCGVGWGCTLIRREVLQKLTVKSNANDAGDMAFASDCIHNGIKQIARFDVPCGHIEPNGTILEPFKNGGIVSRVYALQPVVADVGGASMPLVAGKYYTLPTESAQALARAGYVKITNETEERADPAIAERETAINPAAATRTTRKRK